MSLLTHNAKIVNIPLPEGNTNAFSLGTIATRKFSPELFTTNSWKEVWIGLRCRLSSSVNYSNNAVKFPYVFQNFVGLCNVDDAVFGQSGSRPDLNKNEISGSQIYFTWIAPSNPKFVNDNITVNYTPNKSSSYVIFPSIGTQTLIVDGFQSSSQNQSITSASFYQDYSVDQNNHYPMVNCIIYRFLNLNTSSFTQFRMDILFPKTSSFLSSISRSFLADMFSYPSFPQAYNAYSNSINLGSFSSVITTNNVNSSSRPNGIYLMHRVGTFNLEITDVVTKFIL